MSEEGDLSQIGSQLHERLIAGDPTASAEIAELFLPAITKRLEGAFKNLGDPHAVNTAAIDALISYFDAPAKYDSTRSQLLSYLTMSARGDLLNALKTEKRHRLQLPISDVELSEEESEYGVDLRSDTDVEQEVEIRLSPTWATLEEMLPDPVDKEIILLLMFGIRETYWFAEALGVLDQPVEEQRKIVKRNKDRVKKVLLRKIDPDDLRE